MPFFRTPPKITGRGGGCWGSQLWLAGLLDTVIRGLEGCSERAGGGNDKMAGVGGR